MFQVMRLMQPDGIHPNAEGVEAIVAHIGPVVLELIDETRTLGGVSALAVRRSSAATSASVSPMSRNRCGSSRPRSQPRAVARLARGEPFERRPSQCGAGSAGQWKCSPLSA